MMQGTLIIFLKAPVAGRVKTRLGADIGMGRAAALFRIMTDRTLAEARKSGWRTVLAVSPDGALGGFAHLWAGDFAQTPQGSGSLGERMRRIAGQAPAGPVVIIGADAPGLRARHLRRAFEKLRGADAVFGPARDGGYWLAGLARRRAAPSLFANVRWSTEYALEDTIASLPENFSVAMLARLTDIDDASDLAAMAPRSVA